MISGLMMGDVIPLEGFWAGVWYIKGMRKGKGNYGGTSIYQEWVMVMP
jgi:hypothetical protein